MSVQLVIVALLAATAAAAATTKNTVKYTECPQTSCTDASCKTEMLPVGKCKEVTKNSKKQYWRADDCDADTTAFVVKGYKDQGKCESAEAEKITFYKACKPITYTELKCDGTDEESRKITLSFCSKKECSSVTGGCSETFEFKKTSPCHKGWKLTDETFKAACGESVTFNVYENDGCTAGSPKPREVKKGCNGDQYAKSDCTENDGVSITTCSNEGCTMGCDDPIKYPLKKYKSRDDSFLYIDKCPDNGEETITFQAYDFITEATKTCTALDGVYRQAECVLPASSSDGSSNSGAATTKGSTDNGDDGSAAATTGGSTDNGDGSNNSNSSNGNTSGNGDDGNTTAGAAQLVAPIGAFALFVLAYAL